MLKTKTAAVVAAAAMVSALIPITASAADIPENRGYTEITEFGFDNVIATYCVNGKNDSENFGAVDPTAANLFDRSVNRESSSMCINRSGGVPYLGGFVLDAGEGKTFKDVDEIGLSCVNGYGANLYIYGSDHNIAEAIEKNKDKDLAGNNMDKFTEENLGIPITLIRKDQSDAYQFDNNYSVEGFRGSWWSVYPLNDSNYRYLYIGTADFEKNWYTDEMTFFGYTGDPVRVNTQENCTVTTDPAEPVSGEAVTVKITADSGYEFGKLNVNGVTTMPELNEDRTVATYKIDSLELGTTIDAWADPVGRLTMNEMTKEEFNALVQGIDVYQNLPDPWINGIVSQDDQSDYGAYPTFTVCDAGEGNKYNLTKVITYARASHQGRAHIKIYGTDTLRATDFDNSKGADGKLPEITHTNGNKFYGTGIWDNNNATYGTDSTRGVYDVDANQAYRYIVIAADTQRTCSLTELKIYGSIEKDEPETHDSGYFGFEASEDELRGYNSIAIKLDDGDTYTSDWTAPTSFNGEATVKYAVKITDLPADKNVTNMRLYKADTVSAE